MYRHTRPSIRFNVRRTKVCKCRNLQTGFYIINVNNEKISFLNKPIGAYLTYDERIYFNDVVSEEIITQSVPFQVSQTIATFVIVCQTIEA